MFAQQVWRLAQQGHPVAIATLFNYITQPHGIKTRVQRQGDWLHILLEATSVPNLEETIGFVKHNIADLNVQEITAVTVYGRQQGQQAPNWQRTIYLEPESYLEPDPASAQTAQPSAVLSDRANFARANFTRVDRAKINRAKISPMNLDSSVDLFAPFSSVTPPLLPMESSETPDILKRPQAIVLILFASLLIFWDAYTSLLEEDDVVPTAALSTSQLSRRLQVSKTTIRNRKRLENFSEWTQSLDPDGIAWIYRKGFYVPRSLEIAQMETTPVLTEGSQAAHENEGYQT